jgi:hypothetical protein
MIKIIPEQVHKVGGFRRVNVFIEGGVLTEDEEIKVGYDGQQLIYC